jgi:histidyl-tRNA synthetase
MSIGEMLEIKKDQVLNYDEIVQHHIEIFVKATKKPDCDFEIIKMNHQRYGHIELRKIAIALKNEKNEIEGWVVAFNITAIDKLQAYYDDMTRVIKGKFFS